MLQVGDPHAAVTAMALPQLLRLEVLSRRRLDDRARDQVVGEMPLGGGETRLQVTGGGRSVLAVDRRHLAAQHRELFSEIRHGTSFAFSLPV